MTPHERGAALIVAVIAAIMVTLLAAVVLSVSMERFEFSAFRSDHAKAASGAEAGLRYAFSRLDKDTTSNGNPGPPNGFKDDVRFDNDPPYVVTSLETANPVIDGASVVPDERTNDLFMGRLLPNPPGRVGKEVSVVLTYDSGTGRYRVRSVSDYGK